MRTLLVTIVLFQGISFFAVAQPLQKDERDRIRHFVTAYKQFYDNARLAPDSVDLTDFTKLFPDQRVPIFNDYYDEGTGIFPDQTTYYNDFEAFMLHNEELVKPIEWQIFDEDKTYYAKFEEVYFAWVRKRFKYLFDGSEKDIDTWCRLTIRWINDQDGYRIVGTDRSQEPEDGDHDGIPDAFDDDPHSKPGARVGITGVEIREDLNVVKEVQHEKKVQQEFDDLKEKFQTLQRENRRLLSLHQTDSARWADRDRRVHSRPASRFSLELTGGGVYPLSTSFNRQYLLDYQTNTWKDSGAFANKYGYSGGISLHYYINQRLTMGAGYQLFYLAFAGSKLQAQIGTYMDSHGIDHGPITVSSPVWHLHLLYVSAGVGALESGLHAFRLEPLAGLVRTDMVWDDHLDVLVKAHDGSTMTRCDLPLKYDPFLVLGGKFTYQWGFGEYGNVRFQLSLEYIQGHSHGLSQKIQFGDPGGNFVLPAPDIRLLNLNAGFHFTLHRP